jgi:crotonobetainyl-CoA:carnitine CoA-transferase CaiB-like acyl-CoA transferase
MERRRLRCVAAHTVTGGTGGTGRTAAAPATAAGAVAGVSRILAGVKVIDLSTVIAGPACAAMMADFGASVTKIEPPGGDSWRSGGAMFQQDNRGKRSVCLDLSSTDGYAIFLKMLESTDVVVTNMRGAALKKLRCDYESLKRAKPNIIVALLTAHGVEGPDVDLPGYDIGAFWARTGLQDLSGSTRELLANYPGGNGDHTAAISLLAAALGALYHRERTGEGQMVEASLLRSGIYTLSCAISAYAGHGSTQFRNERTDFYNPLLNAYKTLDGRQMQMLGQQPFRHWPTFVKALDIEDLVAADAELDIMTWAQYRDDLDRRRVRSKLVSVIDEVFEQKTLADWTEIFARHGVWWQKVQTFEEVLEDPQAIAAGAFPQVENLDYPLVSAPMSFGVTSEGYSSGSGGLKSAPALGEHNLAVMREIGLTQEQIEKLLEAGVLSTKPNDPKRL